MAFGVVLRKAYDSVPRQAIWLVLLKYGVPPVIVNLIQSLYDGMKAEVMVDGVTTPVIEANNIACSRAAPLLHLFSTSTLI